MAQNPTLSEAASEYLALRTQQIAARTHDSERLVVNSFVKYANANFTKLGDMRVALLRPQHMEEYFYDPMHGQVARVKPSTFNLRRIVLGTFCDYLLRRGYTKQDQLMSMVRPRKIVDEEKARLSPRQLMAMVDNAKYPRDRVFLEVAINTALRQSEIISLRVKDVDLEKGQLFTRLTKNSKEDYFPINSDLDKCLRRWLTEYAQEVGPLEPDMFLIPAMSVQRFIKGPRYSKSESHLEPHRAFKYVNQMTKDALASVGITDKGEGVHTIRRSIATIYYEMALNDSDSRDDALSVTQALLNHSSVTVTEKYIGKARGKQKRDASLRGKPFLSSMITGDNVTSIEGRRHG